MRLFIAIQFDPELTYALCDFQNNMRLSGVTGNFTKKENLHLTLAFIGEYPSPDEILDVMEDVTFDAFDIEIDGVGMFGDLFWVGLSKSDELNNYVKRLRNALADNGIPFDKKGFKPHITLVRKPVHKDGEKIPVYLPPRGKMTVTRISLMSSKRGKDGMIYTEEGGIDCIY